MPDLTIWKDREINKMKQVMDQLCNRLIDDFCLPRLSPRLGEWPRIDISETEDALIIEVDAPGIRPEAFDISVTEDVLTIKGEAQEAASGTTEEGRYVERRYGTFSRTLRIPCRIKPDEVEATAGEKGILRITMPKCGAEDRRVVRIRIR